MRRRIGTRVSTTIQDFAFLQVTMLVFVVAALLAMVHVPKEEAVTNPAAGDITVEARWDDGLDVDVDLWVQGPLDRQPVGYSRRSDVQFGYVRDDVGASNDSTGLNYEFSFARGRAAGTYVVNVHLYSLRGNSPVLVRVAAALTGPQGRQEIAARVVKLSFDSEEVTAFTFELDAKGVLVPNSIRTNQVFLRNRSAP